MRLSEHSYRTVTSLAGPILFLENVRDAKIGEVVNVKTGEGRNIEGEVLSIDRGKVLIEVYGESQGLDLGHTSVVFTDSVKKIPLSRDIVGRSFNGSFEPIDGLPVYIPDRYEAITGVPINPASRSGPEESIITGLSVIDGLNTLVKGQKLPVFSASGLPSREVVAFILKHATTLAAEKNFMVIFAALGLSFHDYSFYMETLQQMASGYTAFITMADDPVMERLLAPRYALTVAEYLAFEHDMDVLVIMTDMTNYCDALREIATARKELPGRRGYPGYMYSDLASLYERAGRVNGKSGSVTMLPVLTMPEDDITHPIPDLTGYITEGQIVLSRELHQKSIFPPVDALPCLSRLMNSGIGKGKTREDHRIVANLLYKYYAKGRKLRKLEAIIGREGLSSDDRVMLDFADGFEKHFIHQGEKPRDIFQTLDEGRNILAQFSLDRP